MILLQDIKKVAVGSQNPVKIQAVRDVLLCHLRHDVEVLSLEAPHGISDMPLSELETEQGAYNRAAWCMKEGGIEMSFGLEGGVCFKKDIAGEDVCYIFGVVVCIDKHGYKNSGWGNKFILPSFIARELKQGAELGPFMDELLQVEDLGKGAGSFGYFTKGVISRQKQFENTVVSSLVPRLHPDLYTT